MQRHPYILASIIATILAVVVWWIVPKEFAATTKLSDEYKETDLIVGLDKLTASIKKELSSDNENINNIEVYSKTLKTFDFAQAISQKQVPDQHMTYGQWVMAKRYFWQTKDTTEAISDNIEYNLSINQQTLTIQVTDRDALVAAQMLDSVTEQLQHIVTSFRQHDSEIEMKNLSNQRELDAQKYYDAINEYANYCDSHMNAVRNDIIQQKAILQNDINQTYSRYNKTSKQYARQQALMQRGYNSFTVIKSNAVPIENTSHLWVYIFIFILFALVGVKGYNLFLARKAENTNIEFGDIFSPWAISFLVWAGMLLIFILTGNILDPLTDQFYIAISLWLPIFIVSSFATYNLLKHDTRPLPNDGVKINNFIFYLFFIIAIVLSPLFLYKIFQVVSMFDGKDMMKNVRTLAVYGDGQGLLNYAIVISQSLLLVSLWRYPKIPKWMLIITCLCCIINSIALMEKGGIFLVIISCMYVLFEHKVIRIRLIVLGCCITIIAFFLFNFIREGEDSDYSKNVSFLDFISMYVMSPPVAFCRVRQEVTSQFGINTFETIYLFLRRFGFNVEVHEKVQEFVFVPIYTNVYTIMQPFFRDFGYMGVAFFAWVYGLVSGFLYRLSSNGNTLGIILYTYMVYVLVLQFYQENIFLSMVGIIQLCFFVVLFTQKKVRLSIKKGDQYAS